MESSMSCGLAAAGKIFRQSGMAPAQPAGADLITGEKTEHGKRLAEFYY